MDTRRATVTSLSQQKAGCRTDCRGLHQALIGGPVNRIYTPEGPSLDPLIKTHYLNNFGGLLDVKVAETCLAPLCQILTLGNALGLEI